MNAPLPDDKPLIAALHGQPLSPPPVWLMRQAGRYLPEYRDVRGKARNFLDFCYTPELAMEATLQPVRRFAVDAAIIFSDILVIPDALGQKVGFEPGRGPVLEPLPSPDVSDGLSPTRLIAHLDPVYTAIGEVKRQLPAGIALIGFAGAPWTIASYMVEGGTSRGFERLKSWAYGAPDGFARLIELLAEVVADHLIAQIAAGAEAVQIFDSWAGVLPEDAFARWCIAPVRRIVDRVKAVHPGVPVIAFPKGAGVLYERYATESGVAAVSIDSSVPPRWAARQLQPRVAVQGNLDPVSLLVGGDQMIAAADTIVAALGKGPFVFNLGHGVLPETPPDHVARLVDHVRDSQP